MKAKNFDRKFDEGKDVSELLDFSRARRPLQEQKRVNVDFPTWMIQGLDWEARRVGVTRQSIIKVWLAERLPEVAARAGHANPAVTARIYAHVLEDAHQRGADAVAAMLSKRLQSA